MSVNYSDRETPSGVIDGENDTFVLLAPPYPPRSLALFKNGLLMREGQTNDYVLDGKKIIYNVGQIPAIEDEHICWYRFHDDDLVPALTSYEKSLSGEIVFSSELTTTEVTVTITEKVLSGALSFVGALVSTLQDAPGIFHPETTPKNLSGGLTFSGALSPSKVYQRSLSGGLTFGGVLGRTHTPYAPIEKSIGGVLTFGGVVGRDLTAVSADFLAGITRMTVTTNSYRRLLAQRLIGRSPRRPSHVAVGTGRIFPIDVPILGQSRLGNVIIGLRRNPEVYVKEAQALKRLKHEVARVALDGGAYADSAGVAHFTATFGVGEGTGWGADAPREALIWYEWGLFNKASGGVMFARTEVVEGVVKLLGDTKTITIALRLE